MRTKLVGAAVGVPRGFCVLPEVIILKLIRLAVPCAVLRVIHSVSLVLPESGDLLSVPVGPGHHQQR